MTAREWLRSVKGISRQTVTTLLAQPIRWTCHWGAGLRSYGAAQLTTFQRKNHPVNGAFPSHDREGVVTKHKRDFAPESNYRVKQNQFDGRATAVLNF